MDVLVPAAIRLAAVGIRRLSIDKPHRAFHIHRQLASKMPGALQRNGTLLQKGILSQVSWRLNVPQLSHGWNVPSAKC